MFVSRSRAFVVHALICSLMIMLAMTATRLKAVAIEEHPQTVVDTKKAQEQIVRLMASTDFPQMYDIVSKEWTALASETQQEILILLLKSLSSKNELLITEPADMVVESRVKAGLMTLHGGHGLILKQDVYLQNGRAAWAIETLLSTTLPSFTADMSDQQVEQARAASYDQVIRTMQMPEKQQN